MGNMLYNGVELPALPETNQTYKYAIIVRAASAEKYYLRYCNYEVVFNNQLYCKGGGYEWDYNLENGEWVYTGESYRNSGNSMYGNIVVVWTNTDILTVDDGSVYFAGSEPVDPNAPTSTYDRTAFLSGMAMGLTGKGYPTGANGHMSYNGIELADINSIWTDKSNHVFICKAVNSYFAIVSTVAPYQDSVNGGISLSAPFYFKQYGCFTDEALANQYGTTAYTWTYYQDHSLDEGVSNFKQTVIWTSTDIRKDSDGSVFLAASEPIPAGGIGGNDDFTKGYLVGAELRRKRVIVETDVLIDTLPILWNSAEVTNNTKVTFGGMPFVRISNLYADDEGDVRTNAGSLLVTIGGMTITAPLVSVTAYNDNTIFMVGYNVNGEVIYALSIGADNVTFNGTTFPKRGVYVPDVYVIYGEAECEFKSAIENAHSYNGYILPGLPEWDKTAYPYAFIGVAGGSNNAGYVYHLHVSDNPFYGQLSDGLTLPNMPNGGTFKLCGVYEEGVSEDVLESIQTLYGYTPQSVYDGWSAWTAEKSSTVSTTLLAAPVWANHDLVYYSGNLAGKTWVEASEPVPV